MLSGRFTVLHSHIDFHPRLRVITDTLRGAASDVCHFLVMFSLLVFLLSFIGFYLFASTATESFGTFSSSVQTLLLIAISQLDCRSMCHA